MQERMEILQNSDNKLKKFHINFGLCFFQSTKEDLHYITREKDQNEIHKVPREFQ